MSRFGTEQETSGETMGKILWYNAMAMGEMCVSVLGQARC